MEAQEIDDLFLNHTTPIIKNPIITKPSTTAIKKECEELTTKLELYIIRINEIDKEISELEESNRKLISAIDNKEITYKMLSLLLEKIKIDYNFDMDDMEDVLKSIDIINVYEKECTTSLDELEHKDVKYSLLDIDIEIIKEINEKIIEDKKSFFKKFIIFFNNKLKKINSRSKGELMVHNYIYDNLKEYSKIFSFIKNYKNDMHNKYYTALLDSYVSYAKKLYSIELKNHLDIIDYSLKKASVPHIKNTLSIFYKSYFLVIECENIFLKNNLNPAEIFDINLLLNFNSREYKKSEEKYLCALYLLLRESFAIDTDNNIITSIGSINTNTYTKETISFITELKELLVEDIKQMEKEFYDKIKTKFKNSSKRDVTDRLHTIYKYYNGSYLYKFINLNIKEIERISRKNKNIVEFIIYKLRLIYPIYKTLMDRDNINEETLTIVQIQYNNLLEEYKQKSLEYIYEKLSRRKIHNILEYIENNLVEKELEGFDFKILIKYLKDTIKDILRDNEDIKYIEYVK
ncbi:hypothetical protein SLOPH_1746 [Spraguea lophii 42_110]|uniref:Uncharacterized protein n=1 Tax=Spraguea lophii (strain 42_110) TaxID=1358809 RepID=S7W719_SPRLO|nr:hypothetical protein SLOPH_1746 [Spraguea lophii 42_110]